MKETSKANIQKAQDTRRLIGVSRFLDKLEKYRDNIVLWKKIVKEFEMHGLFLGEVKK